MPNATAVPSRVISCSDAYAATVQFSISFVGSDAVYGTKAE